MPTTVNPGNLISPGGAPGVPGPNTGVPIGTIILYVAGGTPPAGWMNCDGSLISPLVYPTLFALIGTTYGGDGVTTFGLPDLRGRTAVGLGQGTGLTNRALAAYGGEEAHILSIAELAAHNHTASQAATTATQGTHTHTDSGHAHLAGYVWSNYQTGTGNTGFANSANASPVNTGSASAAIAAASAGAITVTNGAITVANNGSGSGHNTMPPFLVLSYIIKVSGSAGSAGTGGIPTADTTQDGLLNQVSGLTTDYVDGTNNCRDLTSAPAITLMRLRSLNAIGNPTFEVDQRNAGGQLANPANGIFALDRWRVTKTGSMGISTQQMATGALCVVPGTSFRISGSMLNLALTTQQASLAAGDSWRITQLIEGPVARELFGDVTSVSLLVASSVVPLKFGVSLRDSANTYSLAKLCTISTSGWNLIQLPNVPVFPSGGSFPITPGNQSYFLDITLAAGASVTVSANDTWQSAGSLVGAVGQDNFASKAVNSVFQIAFVQHEPGPLCTTLIDCPFGTNLDGPMGCLRYYQKSYPYGLAPGTVTAVGCLQGIQIAGFNPFFPVRFPKIMAKTPTIIGYSTTSGAANTVRDFTASVDKSVTGAVSPGDSGFDGFTVSSPNAATWNYAFNFTADTGW